MVRRRLVTVLTLNNGVLFRTRNFVPDYRYTLSFVDAWSVDEVVLLDITRPGQGERENFHEVVRQFARQCFVPLTVGGGVRTVDDFSVLLGMGADKVVVNSGAWENPELVTLAAQRYGAQCVVASVDVAGEESGEYEVRRNFGAEATGVGPAEWARRLQDLGAGEILVQSVDRDGTLEGYDNRLVSVVAEAVDIPVLACSGAGNWRHFVAGFEQGGASAVCTTNIYHFTESSIKSAKQFLQRSGIPARV